MSNLCHFSTKSRFVDISVTKIEIDDPNEKTLTPPMAIPMTPFDIVDQNETIVKPNMATPRTPLAKLVTKKEYQQNFLQG